MSVHRSQSICLSLLFALCTAAAGAEESKITVRQIDVRLEGCSPPRRIFLVLNDIMQLAADRAEGNLWRWSASPGHSEPFGIPKDAQISVRFPGTRTRCRHPDDWIENDQQVGVATFSFPSCSVGAVDVTLVTDIEPAISIPYHRDVEPEEKDRRAAPCREKRGFQSDDGHDFLGFWNRVEKLSIFLLKRKKNPGGKALPVDDLLRKNKGRILPKVTVVEPDRVAVIWERREKQPRLSPNEIDMNVRNLDDIHFKSLKLTVK
jgi:hypothetical protein